MRAWNWFASNPVKTALVALVLGAAGFLGAVEKVVGYGQSLWSATFRYPVKIEYVGQTGTNAGYLLHLRITSTSGSTVFIPKDQFRLNVVRDEQVVKGLSDEERQKLVHGETVRVFDSALELETVLAQRPYANATNTVACGEKARDLFLLLTVAGPGDPTLGDRLRLGRAYRSLGVSIRKWLLDREYLDAPIKHVLVIGDENTPVIPR